jgi:hypothetical protein
MLAYWELMTDSEQYVWHMEGGTGDLLSAYDGLVQNQLKYGLPDRPINMLVLLSRALLTTVLTEAFSYSDEYATYTEVSKIDDASTCTLTTLVDVPLWHCLVDWTARTHKRQWPQVSALSMNPSLPCEWNKLTDIPGATGYPATHSTTTSPPSSASPTPTLLNTTPNKPATGPTESGNSTSTTTKT